ncbi:class I SAM-dependent methyltransferase [Svornostia abyssi]|uniref:Class I SAM-dependent methyltransferase n=1 Tax=Svornostia abyssi TaxID=2898438 RepID=A0ABY5PNK1_9ACTN|nr:class I SAM-dependent methyltransferase [Parviterribacteraceae bacterium J379]
MTDPRAYERLGVGYAQVRGEEPRIADAIWNALGDARTVLNVGAGTGSYEPCDREVLAVEPSAEMRRQRAPGAAPAVDGRAEALPFDDGAFDATMAVLSDHHWEDRPGGLRELRRVARGPAVVFSFDESFFRPSWIVRDYFPGFARLASAVFSVQDIQAALGGIIETHVVPIPHDCRDGFLHAYWRRPEAYLRPEVRAGISLFHLLAPKEVDAGVAQLRADLEDGTWARRHADLLERDELDLGYRLFVSAPAP